jgi:hypothetical protein
MNQNMPPQNQSQIGTNQPQLMQNMGPAFLSNPGLYIKAMWFFVKLYCVTVLQ